MIQMIQMIAPPLTDHSELTFHPNPCDAEVAPSEATMEHSQDIEVTWEDAIHF